ncbi:MAG: hypothetical protein EOM67_04245 [Spirochaetia bacterium]|nr:hypothetical protein [Spirochaetia bacterium]
MKRRCRMGKLLFLLTIASFLLLSSCGIPSYLYLQSSDVDMIVDDSTAGTFDVTLLLTNSALDELTLKQTVPSIKLFYSYSTSNIKETIQTTESIIPINRVTSDFESLYRKNNRGVMFSYEIDEAPALYLYRKNPETNTTNISSSIEKFDYDTDNPIDALLLGTFSSTPTRIIPPLDNTDLSFSGAPEMDFTIPRTTFADTTPPSYMKKVSFIIAYDTSGEFSEIMVTTPTEDTFYLGDYKKERFYGSTSELSQIKNQLIAHDILTYEKIISALETPSGNTDTYIHLFASLFGGEGDFNNIVWSPLEYIGAIKLN